MTKADFVRTVIRLEAPLTASDCCLAPDGPKVANIFNASSSATIQICYVKYSNY